ncbi:MAG: hypothetical protein ACI808_003022, partial [Paraglaciecola sp.]
MNLIKKVLTAIVCFSVNLPLAAHESSQTATYLGNEALLVTGTKSKV